MLAHNKVVSPEDLVYPIYGSYKLDGIRCILHKGKALSRNSKPIPNRFIRDTLEAASIERGFPTLDGELMLKGDFNSVQSAVMSQEGEPDFTYRVFDQVTTNQIFSTRYERYTWHLQTKHPYVIPHQQVLLHTAAQCADFYQEALEFGYEGLILKAPNGLYKFGRSTLREGLMLKMKPFEDTEGTVIGFEELLRNEDTSTKRKHNLYGGNVLGALILKWRDVEVRVGSGFNGKQRADLWKNPHSLIGKRVTFKYQGTSAKGVPRFPIFKAFRGDA